MEEAEAVAADQTCAAIGGGCARLKLCGTHVRAVTTDVGFWVTVATAAICVCRTCLSIACAVRATFVDHPITVVVHAVAKLRGGYTRCAAFVDRSVTVVVQTITDFGRRHTHHTVLVHDSVAVVVHAIAKLWTRCADRATFVDNAIAVIIHAIANFRSSHTGGAPFVDQAVAIVVDAIADFQTTVSTTFVDFAVTVVVDAIADFYGGNAVRGTDLVHHAIAVVVHTVTLLGALRAEVGATGALTVLTEATAIRSRNVAIGICGACTRAQIHTDATA